MKSIKEKAETYDRALAKAKELAIDGYLDAVAINDIFPEFAESEDERIRKDIIEDYQTAKRICKKGEEGTKEILDKKIAWLEKQGETSSILSNSSNIGKDAWSEDDKRIIDNLISQLGNLFARKLIKEETKDKYVNWLKSLKPQSQWKPSDEQIEALESATANCAYSEYQDCLRELIEQLKKLKE